MKKIFKSILLFFVFLSLVFPKNAWSGDYLKKGTILEEDSYVFNIVEATDLMHRLSELEEENKKQSELIIQYKELDQNQKDQIFNLNDLLETRELQLQEYQKIHNLDQEQIQKLNKQANIIQVEKWIFFSVGIGVTIGSVLIADKVNDQIRSSNSGIIPSQNIITLKF